MKYGDVDRRNAVEITLDAFVDLFVTAMDNGVDFPHHVNFDAACLGCGATWREDAWSNAWLMTHADVCTYQQAEGVQALLAERRAVLARS